MSRAATIVSGLSTGANGVLAVPVGYLGALTVISTVVAGRRPPAATSPGTPTTRFVVLVPAHNEQTTISTMLASMATQTYPPALFAVHVVADNCDDDTASVSRAAGADVHERFDLAARGKGPALNWLVARLLERSEQFDVAVFVDADTTVAPEFLAALDERFRSGAVAVQGHYGVREAFESVPAALRYCALACRHHLRPLGRTAIGGSCGLFGNGMAFRRELITARRWTDHLVEDMEFQLELLLDGVLVEYEPRAAVEAEMPHTFEASVTQHQRWERGRAMIARRYAPTLLEQAISPSTRHRVAAADSLLDMCVPPLSLLATATAAASATSVAVAFVAPTRWRRINAVVGISLVAAVCFHVATALRMVRAPREAYRALLQAPRLALWKIAVLVRRPGPDGTADWIRTRRNTEPAPRDLQRDRAEVAS